MDLKVLLATGRQYGEYTILPLTLKDIAEVEKSELGVLLTNPLWVFPEPDKKAVFAKWVEKKIRKGGKVVTLHQLIEDDIPMPWLSEMMTLMLESSGFPSPSRE